METLRGNADITPLVTVFFITLIESDKNIQKLFTGVYVAYENKRYKKAVAAGVS